MCETLTMILVVVWAPSLSLGVDIVSKIGIPMILGSVCIGFIVLLVQSVEGEKEASAARQAKLALDIANKTLPLFRHVNSDSLRQVCEIIRRDITADAVAITNTEHVLAYVGVGEANYQRHDDMISPTTRQAIRYGKIIIKNNDEAHRTPEIHSLMVIPLWEKRGGDRHAKNLLLPRPSHHFDAAGDGDWPVANNLHPAGSLPRRTVAGDGQQSGAARPAKQN